MKMLIGDILFQSVASNLQGNIGCFQSLLFGVFQPMDQNTFVTLIVDTVSA